MSVFKIRMWQAVLLILMLFVTLPVLIGAASLDTRANVSIRYALELDGAVIGWLDNASGGNAVGEVVTESSGSAALPKKHLAGVNYEDIVLTVNPSMPKGLYDWIKACWIAALISIRTAPSSRWITRIAK